MDEVAVCREILSRISSAGPGDIDIQRVKIDVCRQYGTETIPKNSSILAAALPGEREHMRKLLLVKPTRTISGVAPVAVMTSPHPCPHGKCLPCPGGPDHEFHSPQSYTGEEPAALRAREHDYDPYRQVRARLSQFCELGHHVDKVELIVMGGTMTARPLEYQQEFVGACVAAMNEHGLAPGAGQTYDAGDLAPVFAENEHARVRCTAITFETRPDWCRREHIGRMLDMGVTKVELGVQHTDDAILEYNRRGCTVDDAVEANRLLRDAGIKVGFHVMPNLPGSTIDQDRDMFRLLFQDKRFRPDFLKIYPTLVTPASEIEELWKAGRYLPYPEEELIDLVAYAKSLLPEYVRLQRMQRDIPARLIVAGSTHSNFRQLAKKRLEEQGLRCRCIRCREAGRSPPGPEEPSLRIERYECCGGTEHFISTATDDSLIGFARLRFPEAAFRDELNGAALLRELHVYGYPVPLGSAADRPEWQHRNFGSKLLKEAEEIAGSEGFSRISVMSGVGVRQYYRSRGYRQDGPYMVKEIS